jgi:hypothetical protein
MKPAWTGALGRCWRFLPLAAWLLGALVAGAAAAADETAERCRHSDAALHANGELSSFRQALAAGKLRVAILGTGSAGQVGDVKRSWPETFKEDMAQKLGGVSLETVVASRRGETAEQQFKALPGLLAGKPALLVWQTGTVDAVRHVDVNDFAGLLIDGIDQARHAGVNVVLVGPQFSPQASTLVNFTRYISIMEQVARAYDVPFLDRHQLMQEWAEDGRVDLAGGRETWAAAAKFVHDCVGRTLAELVGGAAGLNGKTP